MKRVRPRIARYWSRFFLGALVGLLLAGPPGSAWAQEGHDHHGQEGQRDDGYEHVVAEEADLQVVDDREAGLLTVRLGPLELPARSDHHAAAQPADSYLEIPFDGWLRGYSPRLVDGDGEALPGRLLHHVGFWHTDRSDFLCPNKQEHVFGAGGELNEWVALPGYGYRVTRGERIRVSSMFHNPTDSDHPEVWLEVKARYLPLAAADRALASVYPVWFDVQECGRSGYDLAPGTNTTSGEFELPVSGRLLGLGGHLHDFGHELVVRDLTRDTELVRLRAELDEKGRILSMPIVPFLAEGGYRLEEGDLVRVTARYENPTGRPLPDGAMGIAVGYFLPDHDGRMEEFLR